MAESTFQELSLEAAKNFLHSVVVVDDEAYLDKAALNEPKKAIKPGRGVSRKSDSEKTEAARVKNSLNAKELIDKFAYDGLVCAVLKPTSKNEGIKTKVDRATQRADIVILDWKLNESYGDRTLDIIKTILSSDAQEKDRIRLIAIYTGESDLVDISEKIEKQLTDIYKGNVKVSDDKYSIDAKPTRIVLYAKSSTGLPPEHISRVIDTKDLPSTIISEFSSFYSGLLGNTALAALGEIRAITHRILGKFSSDLDEAYLNHRALSNPSDEAEGHVIPLISDEIQDALEGREVHRFLSEKAIKAWLNNKDIKPSVLAPKMGPDVNQAHALERLLRVLQKGVNGTVAEEDGKYNDQWFSKINKLKKGKAENLRSLVTKCFFAKPEDAERADKDFAILTAVRTRYETPPPQMKLGVLLNIGDGNKFFLCIQPLCDSVRLPHDGRDFVFLNVTESKTPDIIVRDSNNNIHELAVDYSPYNSIHMRFKPQRNSGIVVAKENNGSWIFSDSSGKNSMHWMADLKQAHAQRIANHYAAQISRVGLTESEWLRRGAKG